MNLVNISIHPTLHRMSHTRNEGSNKGGSSLVLRDKEMFSSS